MRIITCPYAGRSSPVDTPSIGFCLIGRLIAALPWYALPVLVELLRAIDRQMRASCISEGFQGCFRDLISSKIYRAI